MGMDMTREDRKRAFWLRMGEASGANNIYDMKNSNRDQMLQHLLLALEQLGLEIFSEDE